MTRKDKRLFKFDILGGTKSSIFGHVKEKDWNSSIVKVSVFENPLKGAPSILCNKTDLTLEKSSSLQ